MITAPHDAIPVETAITEAAHFADKLMREHEARHEIPLAMSDIDIYLLGARYHLRLMRQLADSHVPRDRDRAIGICSALDRMVDALEGIVVHSAEAEA